MTMTTVFHVTSHDDDSKTRVSPEDEANGATRFYRWEIRPDQVRAFHQCNLAASDVTDEPQRTFFGCAFFSKRSILLY